MPTDNADDLVPFLDVTVISATSPALLCRIGEKSVWLPRRHISGRLWCVGDRGRLLVRRWLARERQLIAGHRTLAVAARHSAHLRIVRGERLPFPSAD